jgi:hypothetical protein
MIIYKIMEQFYIKQGRKYVPAGVDYPNLHDGIWLVTKNTKRACNLVYYIGDLEKPANLQNHAFLQSFSDDLGMYIQKIQDNQSNEFKDAKNTLGGWIQEQIKISGISSNDLATLLMRFLSEKL